MRSYWTNPTLGMRVTIFVLLVVPSVCSFWWLDTPLYELLWLSPLSANLDIILLPFIMACCFLMWILYDLFFIVRDYVRGSGGCNGATTQHLPI